MDDPDEMFQLADLLEGVSVDCAELSSETLSPGVNSWIVTYNILSKENVTCCILTRLSFWLCRNQHVSLRQ